jgi:hypothetical protein
VLDLLHLDDLFLVQYLDGVEPAIVLRSHQVDSPEGSRTKTAISAFRIETCVLSIWKSANAYLPAVRRTADVAGCVDLVLEASRAA